MSTTEFLTGKGTLFALKHHKTKVVSGQTVPDYDTTTGELKYDAIGTGADEIQDVSNMNYNYDTPFIEVKVLKKKMPYTNKQVTNFTLTCNILHTKANVAKLNALNIIDGGLSQEHPVKFKLWLGGDVTGMVSYEGYLWCTGMTEDVNQDNALIFNASFKATSEITKRIK